MNNRTIHLKKIFPDIDFIGTRPSGEKIRAIMEQAFENNNTVILDFKNIKGINQTFADEIIGIFIRYHGKEFIKSKIKAINYNDEIKEVLNWVVSYSSKWHRENFKKVKAYA